MRERLDPWALVYNLYKDYYTKEQVDEMPTDRKEMWDRFFAKGGEMETIPPHITRDMLERWKF